MLIFIRYWPTIMWKNFGGALLDLFYVGQEKEHHVLLFFFLNQGYL